MGKEMPMTGLGTFRNAQVEASNKGIVDNLYETYEGMTSRMKELNDNMYQLIRYFNR